MKEVGAVVKDERTANSGEQFASAAFAVKFKPVNSAVTDAVQSKIRKAIALAVAIPGKVGLSSEGLVTRTDGVHRVNQSLR